MKCILCKQEKKELIKIYGLVACSDCYKVWIVNRVQREIESNNFFSENERIAVGVSGGSDSIALLHILTQLQDKNTNFNLVTFTVDEGIPDYSSKGLDYVRKVAKRLNVELLSISYEELFGHSLPSIIQNVNFGSPCSVCTILKRRALDTLAKASSIGKIATGHTIDDLAEDFLMNIINGSPYRDIYEENENLNVFNLIQRIKPLRTLTKQHLRLYLELEK